MALFGEDNVLAVYVNTEEHEGWWYEGGGIYRGVTLVKTDRLSAERDGVCVRPSLPCRASFPARGACL